VFTTPSDRPCTRIRTPMPVPLWRCLSLLAPEPNPNLPDAAGRRSAPPLPVSPSAPSKPLASPRRQKPPRRRNQCGRVGVDRPDSIFLADGRRFRRPWRRRPDTSGLAIDTLASVVSSRLERAPPRPLSPSGPPTRRVTMLAPHELAASVPAGAP
jgi:hypothetical protein